MSSIIYECILQDSSSNGTMVNGQTVGRGNSCELRSGDEICVLSASTVGFDQAISWVFRNTTELLGAARESKEASEPLPPATTELMDHVMCPICMLVIHRCVALMPCFHNFCSACCSDWLSRK